MDSQELTHLLSARDSNYTSAVITMYETSSDKSIDLCGTFTEVEILHNSNLFDNSNNLLLKGFRAFTNSVIEKYFSFNFLHNCGFRFRVNNIDVVTECAIISFNPFIIQLI
jgi:hypothetical protein